MYDSLTCVRSHVTSLSLTCLKVKQEQKCELCPSGGQSLHMIYSISESGLPVYLCAQTSLGVSLMGSRYICLFSARPGINDPSQVKLSSLTGWTRIPLLSLDRPIYLSPYERGRRKKWAEINNQTAKFREEREETHGREEQGCRREEKDRDTKRMRWKSGDMQIIYLRSSDVLSVCLLRK